MKLKIFFLFLMLIGSQTFAQKFGYIDTEYIMNKMPEYKKANETMNQFAEKWTKDLQAKYADVEKMKQKFQQEEILLTADMKKEKLADIDKKEEELKTLNNNIFGLNGQLFQKKKEILKPILDEIYKTSEKIARKYKLSFIFDKASDMSMFYADPRHDYTDFIIEELGLNIKK
ncbi:OmpH family outer membrane protein [Lacihabitans sp. CS3-21]|jgi:outer membrane protein|uniref:OmpH family outer membrane protein n=1 Tax=Lacihabitans sp. CS3-21 TaxID=2487332 RepID=UPI0020CC64F0|nr:OmpH family outer membrane protein [Lacihabitans sp. CS3-21]MCP9746576.1 OmpH family outer membrane protein [Lacihabitans sp. CS3-21]